jgi:hypothetical protein
MPNYGVNPWPDDMDILVLFKSGFTDNRKPCDVAWNTINTVIGSRPAIGWAEYLKERDNG